MFHKNKPFVKRAGGRKFAAVTALLLLVSGVLAGCANTAKTLTATAAAAQAAKKLTEQESMKMDVDLDYEVTGDFGSLLQNIGLGNISLSMSADAESNLEISMVKDPQAAYYTGATNITLLGQTAKVKHSGYLVEEDGIPVSYSEAFGIWRRSELSGEAAGASEEAGFSVWAGALVKILQSASDGTLEAEIEKNEQTVNDREVYWLEVSVSGDLLRQLVETMLLNISGDSTDLVNVQGADWDKLEVSGIFYLSEEDLLPVRMEADAGKVGNAVLNTAVSEDAIVKSLDGLEVAVDKLKIAVDFSDYGKIPEITVDSKIKEKAGK